MKAVMYHYVRPESPECPGLNYLPLDQFRKQLDHFADTRGFVEQRDFMSWAEGDAPLPRGVVLTFDDGLRDHYEHVLPELERRGLWALFFVPTAPLDGIPLDVHRLHLILGRHDPGDVLQQIGKLVTDDMLADEKRDEFRRLTYRHQQDEDDRRQVKRVLNYYIDYGHRPSVMRELWRRFGDDVSMCDWYMDACEVREMHESGMLIGAHTVNHPVLSKLSEFEQSCEIVQSCDRLEKITGEHTRWFCYPYGGHHTFDFEAEQILNDIGVLASFNVEHRDVSVADPRQALPRYDCNVFTYGRSS